MDENVHFRVSARSDEAAILAKIHEDVFRVGFAIEMTARRVPRDS